MSGRRVFVDAFAAVRERARRLSPSEAPVLAELGYGPLRHDGTRWWRALEGADAHSRMPTGTTRRIGGAWHALWAALLDGGQGAGRVRELGPFGPAVPRSAPGLPPEDGPWPEEEALEALIDEAASRAALVDGTFHVACAGPVLVVRADDRRGASLEASCATDVSLDGRTALFCPGRYAEALAFARIRTDRDLPFPAHLRLMPDAPARDDAADIAVETAYDLLAGCRGAGTGLLAPSAVEGLAVVRVMADAGGTDAHTLEGAVRAIRDGTAIGDWPGWLVGPARDAAEAARTRVLRASAFALDRLAFEGVVPAPDMEAIAELG